MRFPVCDKGGTFSCRVRMVIRKPHYGHCDEKLFCTSILPTLARWHALRYWLPLLSPAKKPSARLRRDDLTVSLSSHAGVRSHPPPYSRFPPGRISRLPRQDGRNRISRSVVRYCRDSQIRDRVMSWPGFLFFAQTNSSPGPQGTRTGEHRAEEDAHGLTAGEPRAVVL